MNNTNEMHLEYHFATIRDLEILVETRILVLRAANRLDEKTDMSAVRKTSLEYYRTAISDGSHTAILVTDGGHFVGAGGISYYHVMPTFYNPTGEKGYIMNMYTAPEYRRRGIATHTLELLVADAWKRGVTAVSLEATAEGRPLYERFGFEQSKSEMELPRGSYVFFK